jgi:hypothetical protein
MENLLSSANTNRRSAGLYLTGKVRHEGWEKILLANLNSSSAQVFTKCVEVIFTAASVDVQRNALVAISGMGRKYIGLTGRVLRTQGASVFAVLLDFSVTVGSRRMMVELVKSMRRIAERTPDAFSRVDVSGKIEAALTKWILHELETLYYDCWLWASYRQNEQHAGDDVFEDALRERMSKICGWALDVIVLFDEKRFMADVRNETDLHDRQQCTVLIELLETYISSQIALCVIPLLRQDSWELIAKTGKTQFHFKQNGQTDVLRHFIESPNRWVQLCALHCLWRKAVDMQSHTLQKEIMEKLRNDSHAAVAKRAEKIMTDFADGGFSMDPFEVLQRVLLLKKTQLFRNVPAEKLMELSELTSSMSYKAGTLISREGELSEHLYLVASGSLKIVKIKNNVKTILSSVQKGETYGEIGLFNQAPRSASAIANEDCEVWILQRGELKKLLLEMPDIAYNLLEVFSDKLRKTGEEVAELHSALSSNRKEYIVDEV